MSNSAITIVNGVPTIDKNSTALLDYTFDLTKWLTPLGDTISAIAVTADSESGIIVETSTFNNYLVLAWISGGTVDKVGVVTCHVTTNSIPKRQETFKLRLVIT